jgi:RimJ/RimL family protein N-acetyltransferase
MGWMKTDECLCGRRVRLRPPRWEEMLFIRRLWSDPATMAAVGGPTDLSDDRARDWYARMVDPGSREHCYCLILDESDRPIGEVSFHRLDRQMSATLNIKILACERGKGYARDGLLAFLDFFFDRVGGQCITDDVAVDNAAGQQLLLRLGFQHDASRTDVCLLHMTKDGFNALHGERRSPPCPPKTTTDLG